MAENATDSNSTMAASIIKLGNGSYAANRGLIILWVAVQVRDGSRIKQLLAEMQVDIFELVGYL